MSFALGQLEFLPLPTSPLHKRATYRHNYRAWKRRRMKPLTVQNQLNNLPSSFEHLFQSFIEIFPSSNALSYIAPALGLAFYFSGNSRKQLRNPKPADNLNFDIGEWILFASPTPFNRFVTLRCPSICFPGNDMLKNVNEKLVKEDSHYVKLRSGRTTKQLKSDGEIGEKMVYQRICVGTEDGGVFSLDWPANLELEEERGLDTTVLIVPGTVEGSNERKIRLFVYECLRAGMFPVVMNPRGCAASPLTTARLFTAADSDDVSTAVQYVNKRRPWTTLMGVGWGYGANMLTKYLAEFGERTPLTAAACIDNPFDLEEAMRTSVNHVAFDKQHTSGLISILESNKELFQGRGKGFDVTRALSASTVWDFERSISMVSYGFDNITDFYAKSSTRDVIDKVKIPVLFIQNDGTFPLYSIPRGLIAENVYTSLLLCSCPPSNKTMDDRSTLSWCQNLAIEWLTAVELGLLKGRHPLLKDVDVTINPSTDLELVESEASSSSERDTLLSLTNGHASYPSLPMVNANGGAASTQSNYTQDKRQPPKTTELEEVDNNEGFQPKSTIDAEIVKERTDSFATERGQVLQSAEVIMNMLDVTLPNVLSDEQKNKVLNAMGQGKTLINALQGAVPENVRGKLTSAVSGILESHGSDLKFDKLLSLGQIPDIASRLNSKVLEKVNDSKANSDEGVSSSDLQKMSDDSEDGLGKLNESSEKPTGDVNLENQSSNKSKKPNDTGMVQSDSDHGNGSLDLEKGNLQDMGNSLENEQLSENIKSVAEHVSELNTDQNLSPLEGIVGNEDIAIDQHGVERNTLTGESDQVEVNNNHKHEMSTDQNKVSNTNHTEDQSSAPPPASETQVTVDGTESNQENEEKRPQPVLNQNIVAPASFDVSQTLNAFQGFDDSTQVVVNSVFHVIEDMIDQLEVEKNNDTELSNENHKNEVNGIDEVKEPSDGSVSENHLKNNHHPKSGRIESIASNKITQFGSSGDTDLQDSAGYVDKQQDHMDGGNNSNSSDTSNTKRSNTENAIGKIIEPSYVILDSKKPQQQNEELMKLNVIDDNIEFSASMFGNSMPPIKTVILECLNVEVSRKTSAAATEELGIVLARDIEHVANDVSLVIEHRKLLIVKGGDNISELRTLDGENLTKAISSAVEETQYLKRVLPAGVIVGSTLAALGKFFDISALEGDGEKELTIGQMDKSEGLAKVGEKDSSEKILKEAGNEDILNSENSEAGNRDLGNSKSNELMVGAFTAALGSSALLVHHQAADTDGIPNEPLIEKESSLETSNLDEGPERVQNNIGTSLAEKTMSVASPVVPTKEDGKLDHERLVSMLAELGQKGGILQPVGKVALLWGGIRGAMSLADKIISFLGIAERPLFQRIPGFVFMVLLLWSPVIVPLLPSLIQSWATHNPIKFAEFTCIVGLYISVMIMITSWGKRIRKYDDPLLQYGLELNSISKHVQNFLKGLVGGLTLVILIYSVTSSLGFVHLTWPSTLSSSSSEPVLLMKFYGRMLMLFVKGVVAATSVSVVEELLFRSWLPQEIEVDLGYHRGIIISGLVFALLQRSTWEIPGLWLLSLSLAGARQRTKW